MFDLTQQELLDQWAARQLTTETFLQKTDFQAHWGTLSVLYEKILRWSLAEGVPSLALNAPAALSHKLALGQPLDANEKAMLPSGYHPLPGGYEHFSEQMARSPHAGAETAQPLPGPTPLGTNDGDAHRRIPRRAPGQKLVVLLGRGHVEDGFGVPAFVMQKTDAAQLVVYPGGLSPGASAGGGHLALATRAPHPGIL